MPTLTPRHSQARSLSFLLLVFLSQGCHRVEVERTVRAPGTTSAPDPARLEEMIKRLAPLHRALRPPRGADWLAQHHEAGQTFQQYISGYPMRPTAKRHTIYVQPLGDLTTRQRRIIQLAAHETGHMFTIRHCTAHQCNMSGRNSLEESDRLPLPLCPQCMAKVCWASRCDPRARLQGLLHFCQHNGLAPEAGFYGRSLAALP